MHTTSCLNDVFLQDKQNHKVAIIRGNDFDSTVKAQRGFPLRYFDADHAPYTRDEAASVDDIMTEL